MSELDPPLEQSDQVLDFHQIDVDLALERLDSNLHSGLSTPQAMDRLEQYGANELQETIQRTPVKILIEQLRSSLVILLIVATTISILLGEYTDAVAVLAIIVLNTALGFWQDFQAERSLAELKKLSVPEVIVKRNGKAVSISALELVPGDIVNLQTGYFVPADCRIVESVDLSVDESALTGESLPIEKVTRRLPSGFHPVADRVNSAFMGTMVVRGHGIGLVNQTGMQTELGKIASSLQSVDSEPTPLQKRLAGLSRTLAILAIAIVAVVFVGGVLAGQSPKLMLMTALSLAVAVVPEGLPAVATVALAVGARRMFRRNALIRQLPAVETLGSVSVICSDKTGTLTQNRMTATSLFIDGQQIRVEDIKGRDLSSTELALLIAGCLCNDAQLQTDNSEMVAEASPQQRWKAIGEPTETALVELAARLGVRQPEWQQRLPRVDEIAFSSERKRMATRHQWNAPEDALPDWLSQMFSRGAVLFVKGGADAVIDLCSTICGNGKIQPITDASRNQISAQLDELASTGARVLAIAFRSVTVDALLADLEDDLTFVDWWA